MVRNTYSNDLVTAQLPQIWVIPNIILGIALSLVILSFGCQGRENKSNKKINNICKLRGEELEIVNKLSSGKSSRIGEASSVAFSIQLRWLAT